LVTTAFNADFDGDQMAVHVPLSHEAQLEALLLIMSSHNIMHTQNGEPITVPSQDMVLGTYYLTKIRPGAKGEGKIFSSVDEVIVAHNTGRADMHAKVKVRIDGELIETTIGRIRFNQIVPNEIGYLNELLTKKRLRQIIATCFRKAGLAKTVEFLDKLKELGFTTATRGGLSVSIADVVVPDAKKDIINKAQNDVDKIEEYYHSGVITEGERYNKIIDTWSTATNRVADKLYNELQSHKDGFNTFYMMLDSQARGSKEQIRQLAGMRGLMAKPQKTAGSPYDTQPPLVTSGIRLGAAAMTSRGMVEDDMRHMARLIDRVVTNHGNADVYEAVKEDVKHFCRRFTLYPTLNASVDEVGKRIGETVDDAIESVERVVDSVVDEVKGMFKKS